MLHKQPETVAEHLALHLEFDYGLQLDSARHKALLETIQAHFDEAFIAKISAETGMSPDEVKAALASNRQGSNFYAEEDGEAERVGALTVEPQRPEIAIPLNVEAGEQTPAASSPAEDGSVVSEKEN